MEKAFLIKLVVSFIISGIWIAMATLLAEKLGSKIGGLIANLPSNILISLVFVALVNDIEYVTNSVPAIPVGMLIDTLFLVIFIITLQYGLLLSTIVSLLSWFILALGATYLHFNNLILNTILYFVITIIAFIYIEKKFNFSSVAKSRKKYSITQILVRALFAGTVVSSIILISRYVSPYFLGIFSTFPAVLISTMVILVMNQNKEFAQATGKVLILSSTNIVIYGIAVAYTYPAFGIFWGTIISFLASFLWIWIFHPVIKKIQ